MREAPVDLNPAIPAIKPFFYGSWVNTATVAGNWVSLPITAVPNAQGGMVLAGGGCKVPIAGIYHIGAMTRWDIPGTAGANYHHLRIDVNGNVIAYSLQNNGYQPNVEYNYAYDQLWLPHVLNAGDVLTCLAYHSAIAGTVYGSNGWPGAGLRVLYDSPWTGEP